MNATAKSQNVDCDYCGLPTKVVRTAHVGASSAAYCCLGCRIAAGITQGADEQSTANRAALTRLGLAIFFTMNVMVFTLVLWTWNVQQFGVDVRIDAFRGVLRSGCLLFATPVLVLLGGPLLESCLDAWRRRQFTTDVLLAFGVGAAFFYSIASLVLKYPDVYFEVPCMILVAVTLGKWLEATAKLKATQSLRSLRRLLPEEARRIDSGAETNVPLKNIAAGDLLRVLAGERIPVDCVVESGVCCVDEQVVTGESIPRSKESGESLFGGTVNLSGEILVRATDAANTGTIARMIRAVEAATADKCAAIKAADRLAAWFVPLIVAASALAFYLQWSSGIQQSLMSSLSVVLIACPCALGIATPLALWVAISTAARNGVLFRNGDAVVSLSQIQSIGLDKTGTLTQGDVKLNHEVHADSGAADFSWRLAHRLASASTHPLSRAIIQAYSSQQADEPEATAEPLTLTSVLDHAGKGLTAFCDSGSQSESRGEVVLGSIAFAQSRGFAVPHAIRIFAKSHDSGAIVCLGWEREVKAIFAFEEELRPESIDTIESLRHLDLELVILTGDRRERAQVIQNVTKLRTVGELLPEDKARILQGLPRPTAMVGDGINDSLALAKAEVGIAIDSGADVSRDAADVCLMGNSLANLPWAIELARTTRRTIRRNLVWAVAYNAFGICFAVVGQLNPIVAAIAMVGSSLFVLTSSLSLAGLAPEPSVTEMPNGPSTDAVTSVVTQAVQARPSMTGAMP